MSNPQDDDFDFDPVDDDDDGMLPDFIGPEHTDVMFGVAFCNFIVAKLVADFGNEALIDLMFAIDRNMSWSSEILANRNEIDDLLFTRYGAFDQHIWFKIQDTKAWDKMHRQVFKMTKRYLAAAVDEVVQRELQDTQ